MPFNDYSEMEDREILVAIAEKQESMDEKIGAVQETQGDLQENQGKIFNRLEKAERVTKPLNSVRRWSIKAILYFLLASIIIVGLAAREKMMSIFYWLQRYGPL